MKLLALDTSTEACSAALLYGGDIIGRYQLSPQGHSRLILGFCQELLAQAGLSLATLDAIAFGRGPGSFTGLRIGAAVTQGLAFAAELPVVAISSLAAIAQEAHQQHGAKRVLSAIDARMNEVYWGAFELADDGLMRASSEECVCAAASVPLPDGAGFLGAGSGWNAHGPALQQRLGDKLAGMHPDHYPDARHIARLAERDFQRGLTLAPEQALPVYLRNQVAQKAR